MIVLIESSPNSYYAPAERIAFEGGFYTKNHERVSWWRYLQLPVEDRAKFPSNIRWNKTAAAVHYASRSIDRLQLIAQALPEEELARAFPPKRFRALIYAICNTRKVAGRLPTRRQYDTALEIATVLAPFGDLVTGLYETLKLGELFYSGRTGPLQVFDESLIRNIPRNHVFAPLISQESIHALKSPETRLLKVRLALKKWRSPAEVARLVQLEVEQVESDIQILKQEGIVVSNKEGRYRDWLSPRTPPVSRQEWERFGRRDSYL